ncbi:hypothetical protein D3C78_1785890 [compost metagenome]
MAALKVFTLDKDWYSPQDIAYLQTLKGEGLVQLFTEVVIIVLTLTDIFGKITARI